MRNISVVIAAASALLLSTSAIGAEAISYGYDALGRLVGVVSDRGATATATTVYRYDKADNRSTVFVAKADTTRRPIFRFYNSAGHFYTTAFMEGHNAGFSADGPTFYTFVSSGSGRYALYRCYSAANAAHFISTSSACEGQTQEGAIGYAASASATGLSALYRCYRASDKDYLITRGLTECTNNGYASEGILGYVP